MIKMCYLLHPVAAVERRCTMCKRCIVTCVRGYCCFREALIFKTFKKKFHWEYAQSCELNTKDIRDEFPERKAWRMQLQWVVLCFHICCCAKIVCVGMKQFIIDIGWALAILDSFFFFFWAVLVVKSCWVCFFFNGIVWYEIFWCVAVNVCRVRVGPYNFFCILTTPHFLTDLLHHCQ